MKYIDEKVANFLLFVLKILRRFICGCKKEPIITYVNGKYNLIDFDVMLANTRIVYKSKYKTKVVFFIFKTYLFKKYNTNYGLVGR